MFADLGFLVLNAGNGEETTADQDFFISALYGTSHDDDVQVYYGANFAFGGAAAVTYGNRIYTSLHRSSRLASNPLRRDRVFQQSTKLLLHELTHVMQYKAFNGSHSALGWAYIKGYCNAGFDYFRNPFEMEAFQKQEQVNKLLEDEVGTQFMDNWKSNFWATTLGLPTRTEYVWSPNEPSRYFLPFQSGSATLDCNPTSECVGTSKVG
ncbi:MAG: hypothetical protein L6R42_007447 [Xanthoria sp. 1 TBL-2021]|nr:MAG: hypothetical protein L6R42_007447 [Xanthoria sp. 1 TBL-2021]